MFLKKSVKQGVLPFTSSSKLKVGLMVFSLLGSLQTSAWASEHAVPQKAPHSVTKPEISTMPLINLGGEVHGSNIPSLPTSSSYTAHSNSTPHTVPRSEIHFVAKKAPIHSQPTLGKHAGGHTTHEHQAHWTYSGDTGPAHWGDLSPKFSLCKSGKNQSPIDVTESVAVGTTRLAGLDVFYKPATLKIVNNGHTIQVNYPVGSYIKIGHHRYDLLQYHFHTPSEHTRNGVHYPLEMHLVHKDHDGNLAVISVLFEEGKMNPFLDKIILNAPIKLNAPRLAKKITFSPTQFFPKNKTFFKYSGSLTTPPCSEGVYWIVFKYTAQASAGQIQDIQNMLGNNNRPVQPPYARSLLKSYADHEDSNTEYEFY